MSLTRFSAAALFALAWVVTASGRQAEPQVETPVLSPEAEMATFAMAPGYRVELVASEPMIEDPVLVDWDPEGRLWAIEMPGYMVDIQATNEHAPTGRIVVLEDTNNDGAMDTRTVFAEGLVLPRALKVLDHGVLVGEPPNLWLMRDTDGDLHADTKTLVTNRYGRFDASVEHNANGLTWALDNWMYTSEVDMFLRLKNGAFEVKRTLSRGQWGVTQDDAGRLFRNTNESSLHVDLVPTEYYARHPSLIRTRGSYESLEGPDNEVNIVWPARPTPGVNRGYQTGVLRPDGTLARFTSVSSPTVYRGDRLPADVYGNVFVTEPAANLVSRIVIHDDGASLSARKAYDRAEFLASTDERFRPVFLSSAPDGTLYIVDMYRGIIQHKGYITEYLRDQIFHRKLEAPIARGRIFRVMHDTTRRDVKPALSKASGAELVRTLSHPSGWWRDTAQRLLVERGDRSVVDALIALAGSAPRAETRLHALWTLDGLDATTVAVVTNALEDRARDVRTSAVRVAERWLTDASVQAALLRRIDDTDWAVRRQLAASLGELLPGPKERALAMILERHGDDSVVVDAALSGMRGTEVAVLERLLESTTDTAARRAAVTMIAATVVRMGQDKAIQDLFTWIGAETRPEWQRSALMAGAEVALTGATLPGTPPRRGGPPSAAAPACPTCPGARSGPGGAPAFPVAPAAPAATAPVAGRGRAGGPALRLTREPALSALAAADPGPLGQRAASVIARVEWPGKPGAAAPVDALTPDEERRFAMGKELFQNICQACHQPDGRGMERLAPSLVGSEIVLGAPAVTVRVLINGKEGSVGLMPPLGSSLSDAEIAGVLTYIRREWGQTATPVDPTVVRDVRTLTAGRNRPWTSEELATLSRP